jgi:hypothetical protein
VIEPAKCTAAINLKNDATLDKAAANQCIKQYWANQYTGEDADRAVGEVASDWFNDAVTFICSFRWLEG